MNEVAVQAGKVATTPRALWLGSCEGLSSKCCELHGGSTTVPVLAFLGGFGQGSELCKPHPNLKKLEVGFEALPHPMGGSQSPENQSGSQLVS